jgi:aldehyde dehydrogenase (NAD+)
MNEYRECYVAGRWIPATGATVLTQTNPVTEEPLSRLTACSDGEIALAVKAARQAQPVWAASTLDQRRQALQRLSAAIARRTDAFVAMLATELGVPVWVGRGMQVPMPLANLEAMIEGLDQIVWDEPIRTARVVREPVGVVAAEVSELQDHHA